MEIHMWIQISHLFIYLLMLLVKMKMPLLCKDRDRMPLNFSIAWSQVTTMRIIIYYPDWLVFESKHVNWRVIYCFVKRLLLVDKIENGINLVVEISVCMWRVRISCFKTPFTDFSCNYFKQSFRIYTGVLVVALVFLDTRLKSLKIYFVSDDVQVLFHLSVASL